MIRRGLLRSALRRAYTVLEASRCFEAKATLTNLANLAIVKIVIIVNLMVIDLLF